MTGNSAQYGGGIYNDGKSGSASLLIVNSTLSGNSAIRGGGGIRNDGYAGRASVQILNSTFSGNAAAYGGGIYSDGYLGRATVEIGSTILNAGASGGNIVQDVATVTSLGYNLSSDGGGGFLTAPRDQINTDPLLGPLQDNGGPTLTHAPLCGSPAIDKGKTLQPQPPISAGCPEFSTIPPSPMPVAATAATSAPSSWRRPATSRRSPSART